VRTASIPDIKARIIAIFLVTYLYTETIHRMAASGASRKLTWLGLVNLFFLVSSLCIDHLERHVVDPVKCIADNTSRECEE
jgi:hypothetical protein